MRPAGGGRERERRRGSLLWRAARDGGARACVGCVCVCVCVCACVCMRMHGHG